MHDSRYLDDTRLVVPRRASSYSPGDSGWVLVTSDWEQLGDGAIQTTVEDLAKWDANFDQPRVGGPRLVALLEETGKLSDGTPLTYAAGLAVDRYHGMRRVSHGGAWMAFRAHITRIPDRRLSVLLTCNEGDANTTRLSNGVVDAVLGDAPESAATATVASSAENADADAARLAGLYVSDAVGGTTRFALRDGRLVVGEGPGARALVALGGHRYRDPRSGNEWRFDSGARRVVLASDFGIPDTLSAVREVRSLPAAKLADYAGTYRSDELGASYEVRLAGDHLVVHPRRGDDVALRPLFTDAFTSDALPTLRFARDPRGRVNAFLITTRGVHDLRFTRVSGAGRD
jgi:hypothetical protein